MAGAASCHHGPVKDFWRRRWWLPVGLAAWAVLLAALGVASHRDDEPTVREQRSLAQALPVVDEAVGRLVAGAGDSAVPVILPRRIEHGCRITPMRDGAAATVTVNFYTDDGAGLLRRIGASLPPAYRVDAMTGAVDADAGEFVAVRGRLPATGEVRFTVSTGCRPADVAADAPTSASAPCPGGGFARTESAAQRDSAAAPPGVKVVRTDNAVAYRRPDGVAVAVVTASDGSARVYETRSC